MPQLSAFSRSRHMTLLLGALAAVMVGGIILFPDKAFQASLGGLTVWWKFVFPALLPFFILTELMIAFGAAHGFGVLLEPLMRLWMRLPGCAGLAVAMGLTAGMPAGAKMTADLRKRGLIGRRDGERLLAVSHLCSPVLIVTVIGVGFLDNARLGMTIAVVHYAAFLAASLILRIVCRSDGKHAEAEAAPNALDLSSRQGRTLLTRALNAMDQAHRTDGRTFGRLLGDAVIVSVQNLLMIGGYIMMFSVVLNIVALTGITAVLVTTVGKLFTLLGMPGSLADSLIPGLFELHLGTFAAGQNGLSALWISAWIGVLLGWSGFAAMFQVHGLIHSSDLRMKLFILGRAVHSICAFLLTFLLWKPLNRLFDGAVPVLAGLTTSAHSHSAVMMPNWPPIWFLSITALAASLCMMSFLSLLLGTRGPNR